MMKISTRNRKLFIFIVIGLLTLCLTNCSGNSPNGTTSTTNQTSGSGSTSTSATLKNGTHVNVPAGAIAVYAGATTSSTLSMYGGSSGVPISFNAQIVATTSTFNNTKNQLKPKINPQNKLAIKLVPSTLISGGTVALKSQILIDASNIKESGSYIVKFIASYVNNNITESSTVGSFTVNVVKKESNSINNESSPVNTVVSGQLLVLPSSTNVGYNSSENLVLSLSGSYNVHALKATITSSNPTIIEATPSSCILSTESNSCNISIRSMPNESGGHVVITSEAPNYANAISTIDVTNIPTKTYGVLSVEPSIVSFNSNNTESVIVTLSGESNVANFSLNLSVASESTAIAKVSSGSESCNFSGNNSCVIYLSKSTMAGATNIKLTPSDLENYSTIFIPITVDPIFGNLDLTVGSNSLGIESTTTLTLNLTGASYLNNSLIFALNSMTSNIINLNPITCTINTPNIQPAFCTVNITGNKIGSSTIQVSNNNYGNIESIVTVLPLYIWASSDNNLSQPHSRYSPSSSSDASSNKTWMFGGSDLNGDLYNDLWEYDGNKWISINTSNVNNPGSYSSLGKELSTNTPGSRYGASSWVDANGNLFVFGGEGYGKNKSDGRGLLNDLWKYIPKSNVWVWVKGSDTINQYGNYVTRGKYDAANTPGARTHAMSWIDANGKIYLFGGFGFTKEGRQGRLNDLWVFDQSVNRWALISGSDSINQANIVATDKGVFSQSNIPGGRQNAVTWINDNSLYLFGGYRRSLGNNSNDLWVYNIHDNEWAFIGGSTSFDQPAVYGTIGVPSESNIPSARNGSIFWNEGEGKMWLYGGVTNLSGDFGNDLWRFDAVTNQWTWFGGNPSNNQDATYNNIGTINNIIGSRCCAASGIDSKGNLILFGGFSTSTVYNDTWQIKIK